MASMTLFGCGDTPEPAPHEHQPDANRQESDQKTREQLAQVSQSVKDLHEVDAVPPLGEPVQRPIRGDEAF